MKRRSLNYPARALALFGCFVFAAHASASPPVSLAESRQDPLALRIQFTPGSTVNLHYETVFEGQLSNIARGVEQELRMRLEVDGASTIDEVDAEGNAFISSEIQDVEADLRVDGRRQNVRDLAAAVERAAWRQKLSPRNQTLDHEDLSGADPADDSSTSILSDIGVIGDRMVFPERSLAPGAGWEEERRYTDSGVTYAAESRFTFLGYTSTGESANAVVQEDLMIWIEVPEGAEYHGVPGPAMGRSVVTRYFILNSASGAFVRMTGEGGTVMRSMGAEEAIDLTATITESISWSR